MQAWITFAVIGLLIATAVYFSVPGRIRGGLLLTMAVGAAAAVGSAWGGRQLGLAMPGDSFGFFPAVIGTAIIMAIWRVSMGRA